MKQAKYEETIIAESDSTVEVEMNYYFPAESVNMEYLEKNGRSYTCSWKGDADYYDVKVGDTVIEDAAWAYAHPKPEAENIKGYFAFWKGVQTIDSA